MIEAAQAFARRMSRLIRSLKSSRRYGRDRSGTGVSCGAARRVADDTSEAKRMIPRAPARGISSEAKPDQKRARRIRAARSAANDTSAQRRAAHRRNTRRIAGTGVIEAAEAFTRRFLPASPWCSEINAGQPHCPARRGYRRRLSTPVVDGTGVDLAQLGQGSYAPAWAIGTVRLNRFGRGRTNVLMPRAHFPKNRSRRLSARHRRALSLRLRFFGKCAVKT